MNKATTDISIYRDDSSGTFGFRIPYLPDFLADHTLLGESAADRLPECCRRWEYFVGSLWTPDAGASYVLRFIHDTRRGETALFLLGRSADAGRAGRVASALQRTLQALRIPAVPLGLSELALLREPSAGHAFEVRQAEQLVSVRVTDFGAAPNCYLVLPWWGAGGAFLGPMTALAAGSSARVSLAITLEPTVLTEASELADLATQMATAGRAPATGGEWGDESPSQRTNIDPQAEWLGRVHSANLRRLHRPFLVAAHAFSDDHVAAQGVAAALAASIGDESPFEPPIGEPTILPSRADVVELADDERGEALRAIGELRFRPGPTSLTDGQASAVARLRYLCDARGAATAFRLPVSVRGGLPGIATHQRSPDFLPGPRVDTPPPGHIALGAFEGGGLATVKINDLTKHTLITGFTGSGKTVTVLRLLHQLWVGHDVPFLVLESAKQEYRGLMTVPGFEDMRAYTAGNELVSPIRINPFELLPGVRVEAHVGKLQSCFEGAIPPIGPSSSVIAEALWRAYRDRGWSATDVMPARGEVRRRFPVLADFVRAVQIVLKERGYVGEAENNLKAALVGRFQPLLIGGKGSMFNAQRSHPRPVDLFGKPTVLELNDLNLDDKALVVMFMLMLLREHRETQRAAPGTLAHITVVEEAHNVLENVASKGGGEGATSADTRFKAVEAFCQLLTEVRALGEGLVIADQSPEKLARDAVRNTNLQIAHQLRDGTDREAIARAMVMEPEQRDFLAKLRPGQAALFRTGLEKATFIQVPRFYPDPDDRANVEAGGDDAVAAYPGLKFSPLLSDEELASRMAGRDPEIAKLRTLDRPYVGCVRCADPCRHRDLVYEESRSPTAKAAAIEWDAARKQGAAVPDEILWERAAQLTRDGLARAGSSGNAIGPAWCYLLHVNHFWIGLKAVGADPEVFRDFQHALRSRADDPRRDRPVTFELHLAPHSAATPLP